MVDSMELIKQSSAWFLSSTGCQAFSSLQTLEDRSVFLYSYLKTIAKPEFDREQVLFKIAFFLADGVMGSSLPYQAYPNVIDPQKNPFVAYLARTTHYREAQILYYIFLGILHGIADPMDKDNWIYHAKVEDTEYLRNTLEQLGKDLYPSPYTMADPDAYAIDPSLEPVQMKLIWLLGQS